MPTPSTPPQSGVEDRRIRRLVQLACNLRSTWEPRAVAVFDALAPDVWRTSHNGVAVLRAVHANGASALQEQASAIDLACDDLERYLHPAAAIAATSYPRIAYLSADFSGTSAAADHLKAASDLGLPVIGVGLLPSGVQANDLPLRPVLRPDRRPVHIAAPCAGADMHARVWQVDVGRNRLYLLDAAEAKTANQERAHLYRDVVLGVAGARLLAELEPDVLGYHLNGSHAAMLVLELVRQVRTAQSTATFEAALKHVARVVALTTDGDHVAFSAPLLQESLAGYRHELRLSATEFNAMGQMQALARCGSTYHVDTHDIVRGVHAPTWVGPEMATLFDSWLGRVWRFSARRPATWAGLYDVPLPGILHARTAQRGRLMARLHIAGSPAESLVIVNGGLLQVKDPRGQVTSAPLTDLDSERERLLVQGADVWLDLPEWDASRPKAVLNGALCVGASEADELVRLFRTRSAQELPSQWLSAVVRSIASQAPFCTAERMLIEYATRVYCEIGSAVRFTQTARQL